MARTAARGAAAIGWRRHGARVAGAIPAAAGAALIVALATYHAGDPSFDAAGAGPPANLLGDVGADAADAVMQLFGLGGWAAAILLLLAGIARLRGRAAAGVPARALLRLLCGLTAVILAAGALAAAPTPRVWPLAAGLGGALGDLVIRVAGGLAERLGADRPDLVAAGALGLTGLLLTTLALGWSPPRLRLRAPAWPRTARPADEDEDDDIGIEVAEPPPRRSAGPVGPAAPAAELETPPFEIEPQTFDPTPGGAAGSEPTLAIKPPKAAVAHIPARGAREPADLAVRRTGGFRLPELVMLAKPKPRASAI